MTPPTLSTLLDRERPIVFSARMVRAILAGRKTQTRRIVKPRGRNSLFDLEPDGSPMWTDDYILDPGNADWRMRECPFGAAGDRLWVREAFALPNDQVAIYRANWREDAKARGLDNIPADDSSIRWRPSIHMPRWASRIALEVTETRVERLQAISEADAIAEGLYRSMPDDEDRNWFTSHHEEQYGEPPSQAEIDQFNEGVWMVPGVPQGWGMTPDERRRDTWAPTPEFAYRLIWEHLHGKESWAANPWVWVIIFQRIGGEHE